MFLFIKPIILNMQYNNVMLKTVSDVVEISIKPISFNLTTPV